MGKLDGKVCLVTGASQGIGRAIAIGLAREGAKVALAARNVEKLKQVQKQIVNGGSQAEAIPTDLREETQIERLFAQTLDSLKRLDILVNNAGVVINAPIDEMPTESWDDTIATNLRAAFLCTREAFRIMKRQGGGRIINIGSISAQRVRPNSVAYSCAKFGIVGLTHATALEGRSFGISCGCLHPGNTLSELRSSSRPEDLEPMMSVDELAAAVVYMASQPPHINVLEMIQLPVGQLYVGRG